LRAKRICSDVGSETALYWPVNETEVPIFSGHSLVCEKLAPVRTKLIDAGFVTSCRERSSRRISMRPEYRMPSPIDTRAAHLAGLHAGVVGLQLHHPDLRAQADLRAGVVVVIAVLVVRA
jgi:hypothetical protein